MPSLPILGRANLARSFAAPCLKSFKASSLLCTTFSLSASLTFCCSFCASSALKYWSNTSSRISRFRSMAKVSTFRSGEARPSFSGINRSASLSKAACAPGILFIRSSAAAGLVSRANRIAFRNPLSRAASTTFLLAIASFAFFSRASFKFFSFCLFTLSNVSCTTAFASLPSPKVSPSAFTDPRIFSAIPPIIL